MIEKYFPFMLLVSVFVLFHLYLLIKKYLFIKRAILTTAIVKSVGSGSLTNNSEGVYFQNVEFETEQGKRISISSFMGSSSDKTSKGSAVEVLYLSDEPENGVIKDFKNMWGFETIIFLIGFVALLVYFNEI